MRPQCTGLIRTEGKQKCSSDRYQNVAFQCLELRILHTGHGEYFKLAWVFVFVGFLGHLNHSVSAFADQNGSHWHWFVMIRCQKHEKPLGEVVVVHNVRHILTRFHHTHHSQPVFGSYYKRDRL